MPATLFLSVSDLRRLLAKVGLGPFTRRLSERIRTDFLRWEEFEKSPRSASHSPGGVIELMPTSDGRRYAFKYVNGHPLNHAAGLPTVMAFGCLADVDSGKPLLLSEMTILTAIRTAATSAVAALALARPDSKTMAMIGNGAQSEFQILAFHELLGIHRVHLFDTDLAATEKLMRNLKDVKGLELRNFESVAEAVAGCDIVTTSTADKRRAAILTPDMIEAGMHVNAIGGDCPGKSELGPEILHRAKVVVEYSEQTWIEGEIQQMAEDFPITELWQILAGKQVGRTSPSEVTLFDSVGFSIEDFSTLTVVYDLAQEHEIGTPLELIPNLANPKDLYGVLAL